jgi:hypothetical protein
MDCVKQRVLHPSLEYSDGDDLIQSGTTAEETRYDSAAQARGGGARPSHRVERGVVTLEEI